MYHVVATPPHSRIEMLRWLAPGMVYYLFSLLPLFLSRGADFEAAAFLPMKGMALAFCLHYGWRIVPGIFIADLLSATQAGMLFPSALMLGTANAAEGLLAIILFHSILGLSLRLSTPRDIIGLVFLIAAVLQPLSAAGAAAAQLITGDTIPDGPGSPWLASWMASVTAQIVLTPVVLSFIRSMSSSRTEGPLVLAFLLFVGPGLLTFAGWLGIDPVYKLALGGVMIIAMGLSGSMLVTSTANAGIGLFVYGEAAGLNRVSADELFYFGAVVSAACALSLLVCACVKKSGGVVNVLEKIVRARPPRIIDGRRRFIRQATTTTTSAGPTQLPFTLLMVDIDPHSTKSARSRTAPGALPHLIATASVDCIGSDHLIARLAVTKFVVLVSQLDPLQAVAVAERLQHRVSSTLPGHAVVNIGICKLRRREVVSSALRRADAALMIAKRNGQNRVVLLDAAQRTTCAPRTGSCSSPCDSAPD